MTIREHIQDMVDMGRISLDDYLVAFIEDVYILHTVDQVKRREVVSLYADHKDGQKWIFTTLVAQVDPLDDLTLPLIEKIENKRVRDVLEAL